MLIISPFVKKESGRIRGETNNTEAKRMNH